MDYSLQQADCYLRDLTLEDASLTFKWRQLSRAKYLNAGASSVADQETWIKAQPSQDYNMVICLSSGEPVGTISLTNIDVTKKIGMSGRFLIGEDQLCEGKPIAFEAMLLLYELAFVKLGLNQVFGFINKDNKLMIKWQKVMGMNEIDNDDLHFYSLKPDPENVFLCIDRHSFEHVYLTKIKSYINVLKKKSSKVTGR